MDKKISYTISNAVTLLSIGEMLDVDLTLTFNKSYDKYFNMIYKKTASLIEASAKSAALLVGKDDKAFALYGKNLGLAFQMIDDILDITQNSETLGKPAMSDFIEGKVTIPYLLLYERIEDKNRLESLYKITLKKEDESWIKDEMIKNNVLIDSISQAQKLGIEAIEVIKNDENEDLKNIMNQMINREF
jgi:octaprenyl-diphosphate synthase